MEKFKPILFGRYLIAGILSLILWNQSIAQIPNGYYDSANGLDGDPLKTALHNIIDDHAEFPYTSSSTDTWDILKVADRDPANSSNVLGIYSGFSMNAALEYDNANGWNREHVWAKSRGDFGTSLGAGTDTHHLRAADISTNSARNNRNFDEAPNQYVDNSGQYSGTTQSYTSSTDWIWEPPDNVKGDIARILFYMDVRYEGDSGEPDLELTDVYQTSTSKEPLHARFSTLITWHNNDPVDDAERARNDVIFSYQQNRNPFIDHPEFVDMIWFPNQSEPSLEFNPSTLVFDPVIFGEESDSESYQITAQGLELGSQIEIIIPSSQLELSVDQDFQTAIVSGEKLETQNGELTATIYVRFRPGTNEARSESFELTHNSVPSGQVSGDLRISTETIPDLVTAVQAEDLMEAMLITPNPVLNNSIIRLKINSDDVLIYNQMGKKVLSCRQNCQYIVEHIIKQQSPGLYYILNGTRSQRVLIQR